MRGRIGASLFPCASFPVGSASRHRGWRGMGNYIHRNPVRAGIVASSEDYRFSSARLYLQGRCFTA